MASTKCYVLTFWSQDPETNILDMAIKTSVNTPDDVDWTEVSQPDSPADGDAAVGFGFYRNANELSVLTSATSPTLAPATCRHFFAAYRTEGGDPSSFVTNYGEVLGTQGLTDTLDWLNAWYPTVRTAVAAVITASSTHLEAVNAVIHAINPSAPPVS